MRNIVLFICIFSSTLSFSQGKEGVVVPPPCRDSVVVEEIRDDDAAVFFFGDAYFLEKHLQRSLHGFMKDAPPSLSGNYRILIQIDSFGVAENCVIISGIESNAPCDDAVIAAVRSIKRWKPNCIYNYESLTFECTEKTLYLNLSLYRRNIYINGKRELPLRYRD